jgi:hypothetical protein
MAHNDPVENQADERSLKKTHARDQGERDDLTTQSVKLTADFFGDLATAAANGWRSFREQVTSDNIRRIGPDNGIIAGSVAATTHFFEHAARSTRETFVRLEQLQSPKRAATDQAVSTIDYERLAKLVAAELGKTLPTPSGPAR